MAVNKPDRADTVLRSLLRELACNRWGAGSRLPAVRRLESEFVTSRVTMLEVLHRAEEAGLIEIRPRQGATVRADAPRLAATMLANRRSASRGRRVAVLIPDYYGIASLTTYYVEFARDLVEDATRQNMAAEVVEIPILNQVGFAAEFASRGFGAAMVLGYVPSYLVSLHILMQQRFPVLLINREPRSLDLPWVNQDDVGAIQAAVAHLTSLGHRRLCLVRRPLDAGLLQRMTREKAWLRTLRRAGLLDESAFPVFYIPFGDVSLTMGGLLDHPRRPTALLFENGDLCERFLRSRRFGHLSIPRDLSVMTFDRIHEERWALHSPPVTTIEPDRQAMASAIFQRVNEMLRGNVRPENGAVPMTLKLTESVGSPPPRSGTQ